MIRQCIRCKRILSDKDFHTDKKSPDGLRTICKTCAIHEAQKSHKKTQAKNHGLIDVYYDIKKRCYDAKSPSYARYGGRGITMCDEWRDNRDAFVKWCVANGHKAGLQIDRIDNDGNYCPENCRFVTPAQNQHNTSQTALNDKAVQLIRGNSVSRRFTQREMAKKLGVSQSRISDVENGKSWKDEQ